MPTPSSSIQPCSSSGYSTAFHPGIWYSNEYSVINYRTGKEEQRSYHLKGFTPDEEREVHAELKSGRHI